MAFQVVSLNPPREFGDVKDLFGGFTPDETMFLAMIDHDRAAELKIEIHEKAVLPQEVVSCLNRVSPKNYPKKVNGERVLLLQIKENEPDIRVM